MYWYMFCSLFFLWAIVFIMFVRQNRIRRKVLNILLNKKHHKTAFEREISQMEELAKRFLGKKVIVHTVTDSPFTGILEEVTSNALLVNCAERNQLVNLEYVISIQVIESKKKK